MRKWFAVLTTVAMFAAGGLLADPAQAMTTGPYSDELRAPGALMDLASGSGFDRTVAAAEVMYAAQNRPWNGVRGDGSRVRVFVVDDGIGGSASPYGQWQVSTPPAGEFPPVFAPGFAVDGLSENGSTSGTNTCSSSHGNSVARAIYTVAPGAVIVPVRVTNCREWVTSANLAAGLAWVKAHGSAGDVVNISMSGMYYYASTLNELSSAGMVVVVGANNTMGSNLCTDPFGDGSQSSTAGQWASIAGVVVSGVVTGMTAPFGAGSSCVEVVAPALTDGEGSGSDPGVSMATALTSGVAAAWSSGNPNESASSIVSRLINGDLSVGGDVAANATLGAPVAPAVLPLAGDWSANPTSGRRVRIAGPPSGPRARSAESTAQGTVALKWDPPLIAGGTITGYSVAVDGTAVSACSNLSASTTTCEVSGLSAGTHAVQVRAINSWGSGAIASTATSGAAAWSITAQSTPGTPTSVTATASGAGKVDIGWSTPASTGGTSLTSYEVLENAAVVATAAGTATSTTLSGLTAGAHTFTIRAVNSWGAGSSSTPATVTVEVLPGSPAISSLTATGAGQATITWTAPASTGGTAITGYEIREGVIVLATVDGAATSTPLTGLAAGAHTITVRAVNRWGAGSDSVGDSVTIQTKPGAPSITALVASGAGEATITWTAPASTGGTAITEYEVLETEGQIVSVVATAAAGATTKAVTLVIGTHDLSVRAINRWGAGPASSVASVNVEILPGTPSGLALVASGAGKVTATWTAPDNGGTALTGYQVREAGSTIATADGAATTATVSGLTAGSHAMSLRAVNRWGNGAATSAVSVTVEVLPSIVRNVAASNSAAGQATITWTAPASTGGTPITGYEIVKGGTVVATPAAGSTSAVISDMPSGEQTLAVRAVNRWGAGPVGTDVVTITVLPGTPVISGVTATAVGKLHITWTAVNNGGTPLVRYELLEGGTVVATPAAGATAATLTGLAVGDRSFTVRAVNKWGAGEGSAVAIGSAEALPGAPTLTGGSSTAPGQVELTWSAPASTGGTAITGYEIVEGGTVVAAPAGPSTTASVTGLAAGNHSLTVRAVNRWGDGPVSGALTFAVTAPAPASPAGGGSSSAGGGGGGGGGGSSAAAPAGGGGGGGSPQEILSMRPWKGPRTGGYTIAVVGNGLKDATAVLVDGVKATFTVHSDAHVDVVIPAGKRAGQVPFVIVISPERGTAPATFTYTDDSAESSSTTSPSTDGATGSDSQASPAAPAAATLTATRKAAKVTVRMSQPAATKTTIKVTTVPAKATKAPDRAAAYRFTTTVTSPAGKTTAVVTLPSRFVRWTGAVRVTAASAPSTSR